MVRTKHEEHKTLKEYCDKKNIIYSTSVWDSTSAKEIIDINPEFIKVPSACNNNYEMLEVLRDDYKGHAHIHGPAQSLTFDVLGQSGLALSAVSGSGYK